MSDESEALILVDSSDIQVGSLDKYACHNGDGILHRAFSLFVFNPHGELLLQRRARTKRLWPGYWSNSCCSHPRVGESLDTAVERRSQQELGFSVSAHYVYKFEYHARFQDIGSERELCSVYIGHFDGQVKPNSTEIEAIDWLPVSAVSEHLAQEPELFTPWFKQEWAYLRTHHAHALPG